MNLGSELDAGELFKEVRPGEFVFHKELHQCPLPNCAGRNYSTHGSLLRHLKSDEHPEVRVILPNRRGPQKKNLSQDRKDYFVYYNATREGKKRMQRFSERKNEASVQKLLVKGVNELGLLQRWNTFFAINATYYPQYKKRVVYDQLDPRVQLVIDRGNATPPNSVHARRNTLVDTLKHPLLTKFMNYHNAFVSFLDSGPVQITTPTSTGTVAPHPPQSPRSSHSVHLSPLHARDQDDGHKDSPTRQNVVGASFDVLEMIGMSARHM